jgi:hypothetical protein
MVETQNFASPPPALECGGVWRQVGAPTVAYCAAGSSVKVILACVTEGASMAYTTDEGASRLGYLDSNEVVKKYGPAGK